MKLWIARDKDKSLYLYKQKPQLSYRGTWANKNDTCFVKLPMTDFPEVTFENSPQQVELKLVKEGVTFLNHHYEE